MLFESDAPNNERIYCASNFRNKTEGYSYLQSERLSPCCYRRCSSNQESLCRDLNLWMIYVLWASSRIWKRSCYCRPVFAAVGARELWIIALELAPEEACGYQCRRATGNYSWSKWFYGECGDTDQMIRYAIDILKDENTLRLQSQC